MTIGLDFDGTCVTHEYPQIGKELPFCVSTLHSLIYNGHHIILNTMRSGKELEEAIMWFKERNIPLYGINVNPEQYKWTLSPKVYANIYIDDAALGCPLIIGKHEKPYVNWLLVFNMLNKLKYFQYNE